MNHENKPGSGTALHSQDFDFDDELEKDSLMNAYGFVHHSLPSTYVEDMRGNSTYSLNMDHVKARLDRFWILLDNQSTVNIFWNTMFLINVRKTSKRLELHTNAGSTIIDEIGELPGVGTVWVHRNGIANILSFHSIQEINKFEIDYSSRPNKQGIRDRSFKIESPENIQLKFIPDGRGLYFLDCQQFFGYKKPNTVFGSNIVNTEDNLILHTKTKEVGFDNLGESIETIEGNVSNYAKRDVLKAKAVRRFQHIAGHPSERTILAAVTNRTLKNIPFVPRDVSNANKIMGTSVYGLKGKRTSRTPDTVEIPEIIPLPKSIEENYKHVTMGCDVLHINGIPFMATISRAIHYATAAALPTMTHKDLQSALTQVIKSYRRRGFTVKHVFVDIQFEGLCDRMKDITNINVVSKQEHVPEMERFIRVIKERARSTFAMLPFERIPKKMLVAMVSNIIFYINAFPWPQGVSQILSPYTILEGMVLDFNLHFQVIFGEYAQTYEGTDNTPRERTIGAIALGPSGNIQGGVRFFSLDTGEIINRSKVDYTLLPMPADVIKRVNRMARKSRKGLLFTDRHDDSFDDDDDDDGDEDYDPNNQTTDIPVEIDDEDPENVENDNDDHIDDDIEIEGVDPPNDNDYQHSEDDNNLSDGANEDSDSESDNDDADQNTTRAGRVTRSTQQDDYVYMTIGGQPEPLHCDVFLTKTDDVDIELTQQKIQRLSAREIDEFKQTLQFMEDADLRQNIVLQFALAQLSVSKGIKVHGKKGKDSVMKEINNLVDRDCFGETDYDALTPRQKKMALPILMFMIMKRNGELKTRGCADGRPQRLWTDKATVSSPTPAIECIKYILAVIAFEKRDVASFDLPAQFLQTEMDELIHLRITGAVALLLVESDPERWQKHLRRERGRPVVYVECKKAIYGTLSAAILAYRKLTSHFEDWGFEMNPYEPCVWNKMINGKQMTVVFHVDDGIVSHEDPEEVTKFLELLKSVYGKTDPLTIRRKKIHEYLGMTLDFTKEGSVTISMYDYVKKLLDKIPESMRGTKPTAAPEYLFKTNDTDSVKLNKELAELYHTITATTLYLGQRARPDLQLAVSFLCTRVKSPDEHDWKKLTHLMMYLQGTAWFPMTIGYDGNGTVIHIDGSHAVHADMKGHVGLYASEGKGAMYSSSTKMKLNTVSSTETEIVSVGEKLPKVLWYRLFRIAQGGYSKEDILMQDNQSAILLENNGRFSVGKGSKHIDIRYFFITNRIEKKHVKVKYCPTEEMIADFFTKPLQGALFFKFRNEILGIRPEDFDTYKNKYHEALKGYDLSDSMASNKSKECVGRDSNAASRGGLAGARVTGGKDPLQDQTYEFVNSHNNSTA